MIIGLGLERPYFLESSSKERKREYWVFCRHFSLVGSWKSSMTQNTTKINTSSNLKNLLYLKICSSKLEKSLKVKTKFLLHKKPFKDQ